MDAFLFHKVPAQWRFQALVRVSTNFVLMMPNAVNMHKARRVGSMRIRLLQMRVFLAPPSEQWWVPLPVQLLAAIKELVPVLLLAY